MNKQMVLLIILLSVLPLGTSVSAGPLDSCRLKIAWEDWKPYIYEEKGQLQGLEYSLLMKLAEKAGCEFQFVEEPWIRSLDDLKNKKVDVLYGASYTKERDAFATFSVPYRYEEFVFISNVEMAPKNFSLVTWLGERKIDKSPKTIGLIRGFYYGDKLDPIVRNHSGRHKTHEVRSDDQLEKMLKYNRIDGFIVEKLVAEQMLKFLSNLKLSQIQEVQPEPMYLMFSNEVPQEVIMRFNTAISEMREKK